MKKLSKETLIKLEQSEFIAFFRKKIGMSQLEFCEPFKTYPRWLVDIEKGRKEFDLRWLPKLIAMKSKEELEHIFFKDITIKILKMFSTENYYLMLDNRELLQLWLKRRNQDILWLADQLKMSEHTIKFYSAGNATPGKETAKKIEEITDEFILADFWK